MKAIESSDIPLVYKLHGSSSVTSLPYIDSEISKRDRKLIRKMINSELKDMNPKTNYLEDIKEPKTPNIDKFTFSNKDTD